MSGKVMGAVFGLDLRPVEMLVLLAYCDHAEDDGSRIYPGARLMAWKTHLTVREIRKITKRLVELNLLVPLSANAGGHHENTTRYRANLDAVPFHAPRPTGERVNSGVLTGEQPFTRDDRERVNSGVPRVNSGVLTGEQPFTQTVIKPSSSEPSIKPSSSATPTDDDDLSLTLTWLASECPRLTKIQLTELSLLIGRIPVGHQRRWCDAAVAGIPADVDSPYRWLLKVLTNAVNDNKCPSGNGRHKGIMPVPGSSEARKAMYGTDD